MARRPKRRPLACACATPALAGTNPPAYRVGQVVCRVGRGIDAVNRRLAIAEVDVAGHDNRGRARPAVRAWTIHWDGKRGEKADKYARPAIYLLEEIGPCK